MTQARPTLSPYMTSFLAEASLVLSRPTKESLEHLLLTIEILSRNGKLDIGLEWTEVMNRVNQQGLGVKPVAAPTREGGLQLEQAHEPVDFDVSMLETSTKNKSGLAGVYATTGGSFRSLVPDPKAGSVYLGSWPSAVDAAIDRFNWFEERGIPYGNIGRCVEEYQKRHPEWSIERCLLASWEFLDSCNQDPAQMKWPFTGEQIKKTIERYRAAHGLPNLPIKSWNEVMDPRAQEAIKKSAETFVEEEDDGIS